MSSFPNFEDSDSDQELPNINESRADGTPNTPIGSPTAATPSSPEVTMEDLTPRSKNIAKVVTANVKKMVEQESRGVKRKLDMLLDEEASTSHGVSEVKTGMQEIKRTTMIIEANQKKSIKQNPQEDLSPFQRKQLKAFVWSSIKTADPKEVMLKKVYTEMAASDETINKEKEDNIKKVAQGEASNVKAHLRGLVADDLMNKDLQEFNLSAQYIKKHLSLDYLTESDLEFLRIMATATIKFDNGKQVELEGKDLTNKEKMAGLVGFWWAYVGRKMKKFEEDGMSCAGGLEALMARHGFEGKDKKKRQSLL